MTRSHEWLRPQCAAPWWSQHLRRGAASAILCAAVFVGSAPTVVRAAGVVGTGTASSCTDAAFNGALARGRLVTFNCGSAPVTIDISTGTGTKTIRANTTIDGGGLITISGGNSVGVFSVNTGVTFTVKNLTIANGGNTYSGGGIALGSGRLTVTNSTFSGNAAYVGGGIASHGTLTVSNSTFSGNNNSGFSAGYGGGIASDGTLTVTNCTFFGNSGGADSGDAGAGGGGIASSGTLTVTNSTFSGNSGGFGGGILHTGGTLTVTNSTFSGNSSGGYGEGGGIFSGGVLSETNSIVLTVTNSTFSGNSYGGIYTLGTATVSNSTISGNGPFGIGIGRCFFSLCSDSTLAVTNSIVADSRDRGDCIIYSGTVADGGHNLIGDAANSCGLTNGVNGNVVGMAPLLDPTGLKDNGGSTQTIALLAGSPAINAGDETVCAALPVNNLDQRGYRRPGLGATNCSIGAYEFNSLGNPTPAGTATSTATTTPTSRPKPTPTITSSRTRTATATITPTSISTRTPTQTATHTPTHTPTVTAVATITPTPTVSATIVPIPTRTAPPTSTPRPCIGDCDGTSTVTIEELLTMVNIALGTTPASACLAGDDNQNEAITVDEIIVAVNNALSGCPVPPTP